MNKITMGVGISFLFFICCGSDDSHFGRQVSCGFPFYLTFINQAQSEKQVIILPAQKEHFISNISQDTLTISSLDSLTDTIQYNWTFTNYDSYDCMLIDGYKYQLIVKVFNNDSLTGYYTINPVDRYLNSQQYSLDVPGEVKDVFKIY
jgi:hypothetical protein